MDQASYKRSDQEVSLELPKSLHNTTNSSITDATGARKMSDPYRTRISIPRLLAVNWCRLALALSIFALESAITAVFHLHASDSLLEQFPMNKTVMGFLYGLLVLIFWNRARNIAAGTILAHRKYAEQQSNPASPSSDFRGLQLPRFRRTIAIVATSVSFLGSFGFAVITSLLFVDVMQTLRSEGDYTMGITLLVLYSLLLFCAIIAMLTGIHGSISLLLLLKALPKKFYPLKIWFGINVKPESVLLR